MDKITASRYRAIFWNSIKIALLVGTVLNLVNQGEEILAGGNVIWAHIALNYCVPFFVSGYSAIKSTAGNR